MIHSFTHLTSKQVLCASTVLGAGGDVLLWINRAVSRMLIVSTVLRDFLDPIWV